MKIVVTRSNQINPDPRVEKIAKTLNDAGHTVSIVAWNRSPKTQTLKVEIDVPIFFLHIPASFGRGLANLPALIRWQFALLFWLIKNRSQYVTIHSCDFDTVLPALFMKWFFKKKLVYDIFDFFADRFNTLPKLLLQLIRKTELFAIGNADVVILADESRKQQIAGSKPKKLEYIINSPIDIRKEKRSQIIIAEKNTFKKDKQFHIVFIGLLQAERGLFELIEVMFRHSDWFLDLAGYGNDELKLLNIISNMKNVKFHGRIPYSNTIEISMRSDVLIAYYDPKIPNHRYSSSNKLFEAMMLSKPIIVAENTNMDRIVTQSRCGMVVPYGDVEKLDFALNNIANDHNLRKKLGIAGRKAYEELYSWDIMKNRLIKTYEVL